MSAGEFTRHECSVVTIRDESTGVSHVGFNLPNGNTLMLPIESARVLANRLLAAADAAQLMNETHKGALN